MLLPRPAIDEQLPHGFTISRVNGIAGAVVWQRLRIRENGYRAEELKDYSHAARAAIVERLYLSDEAPTYEDLLREAQRAIRAHLHSHQRYHGITRNRETGEFGVNNGYLRFWTSASEPTQSPEDAIVEPMAMMQILETLRPAHKAVLNALAEHGYYGVAAEALGKSRKTFTTQVAAARREFLILWHEGESPSRAWGHDRRRLPGNESRETATYVLRRRQRIKERTQSDADKTSPPDEDGSTSTLDDAEKIP